MSQVYSRADRVLVWLGPGDDQTHKCFEIASTIVDRYAAEPHCGRRKVEDVERLHKPMIYEGMLDFMNVWRRRDFDLFKRTWVLQEVANAKIATVQCGRDSLPWPVMVRIADCCIEAKRVTSLFRNAIMPPVFLSLFTFVDGTAVAIERSPGRSILDILVRAHDLQASDPRDKIFALLQFGTDTSDVGNLPDEIRPDYSKSTMQVFTDFTRWWITAHKSLRILSAVHTLRDRGWQQMSTTEPLDPSTLPQPA